MPLRTNTANRLVMMICIIVAIGIVSGSCNQVPTATAIAPAAVPYVFFPSNIISSSVCRSSSDQISSQPFWPQPYLVWCTSTFSLPRSAYYFFRLAVFADRLKALAVGAPFAPGRLIFSPLPALMRFRLAWMLAYNPFLGVFFFAAISNQLNRFADDENQRRNADRKLEVLTNR